MFLMQSLRLVTALLFAWQLSPLVTSCIITGSQLDLSSSFLTGPIDATVFNTCTVNKSDIDEISLSGNSITDVDPETFLQFFNVKRIDLSNNTIQSLHKTTFTGLPKLEELDLSFNDLTKLKAGTFDVYHLIRLYLQNNDISIVEPGIFTGINENLRYVNLNNNSLTTLEPWMFLTKTTDDERLDRLFDIQYNNIKKFTNTMGWVYDLTPPFQINVNLQFNELREFGLDTIRQFTNETDPNVLFSILLSLYINGTNNPYICDCKLYDLAHIVQTGFFRWKDVESYIYLCDAPLIYHGEDWFHYLPLSALVCNRTDNCPRGCFCQDRPHNDTFYINCDGAGLTEMPDTIPTHERSKLELNFNNNNINALKNVSYNGIIYNLSLVNNEIGELGNNIVDSFSSIAHLDLRQNRIANLPKDIQRFNYGKILLKGNPLRCDCNSIWMSEWLNLYQNDGDTSLTCTSKQGEFQIISLTLEGLGCTNTDLIIIITSAAAVVAAVGAIFAFSRICPYETKVTIHKLFGAHPRDKYLVDDDLKKTLDIYLIFDRDDDDVCGWIRYFQRKLQRKKPLYSIINPLRYSEGEAESVTYTKWISKCKRVVIVLSKDIFDRRWEPDMILQAENNLAEAQARQNADKDPDENEDNLKDVDKTLGTAAKIIYIIYNNDKDLTNKLNEEPWKSKLSGKTVLQPLQKMFWSKLRYELPPKGNGQGDGSFFPPREDHDRGGASPVHRRAMNVHFKDETVNNCNRKTAPARVQQEAGCNKSAQGSKNDNIQALRFSRHSKDTSSWKGCRPKDAGFRHVNQGNQTLRGENLLKALEPTTSASGNRLNLVNVHTSARGQPGTISINKGGILEGVGNKAGCKNVTVQADVHQPDRSGPISSCFITPSRGTALYSRGGDRGDVLYASEEDTHGSALDLSICDISVI